MGEIYKLKFIDQLTTLPSYELVGRVHFERKSETGEQKAKSMKTMLTMITFGRDFGLPPAESTPSNLTLI